MNPIQAECERLNVEIATALRAAMPPGYGFLLVVFDFGKDLDTFMAYSSNARRDDMIAMLDELSAKLKGMRDS